LDVCSWGLGAMNHRIVTPHSKEILAVSRHKVYKPVTLAVDNIFDA